MYHFPLETCSSSSVFVICCQVPKLEALASSYTPFSYSSCSVGSTAQKSVNPITASPEFSTPYGCQGYLSKIQIIVPLSFLKSSEDPPDSEDHTHDLKHGLATWSCTSWLQPCDNPLCSRTECLTVPSWGMLVNASISTPPSHTIWHILVTSGHILLFLLDLGQLSPLLSSLLRPPNQLVASSFYLDDGSLKRTWVLQLQQTDLRIRSTLNLTGVLYNINIGPPSQNY